MNRRQVLRSAGVSVAFGLAGCSELVGDGRDGTPDERGRPEAATDGPTPATGTPTETRTPTDGGTDTATPEPTTPDPDRCVSVFGRSPPSTAPVRYALTIEAPTPDRPPVLRTRITNAGDETIRLGEQRAVQHHGIRSANDALMLRNPGRMAATDPGGCWGLSPIAVRSTEYAVIELSPGETATSRSYVLGARRDSGHCLPPGLHAVEPRTFWSGPDGFPDGDQGHPLDWSFVIGIGDGLGYCPVTADG